MQFRPAFFEIRHLFEKYYVNLCVKELLNVAQTIFVVSPIHMNCIKPKMFS